MSIYAIFVLFNIIAEIFINIVTFNFIYSRMDEDTYLKDVLIFTVCMGIFDQIKLFIVTNKISIEFFFTSFGIYYVIGLILIFILNKLCGHFGKGSFIVIATILDMIIQLTIRSLLNLNLYMI